MSRQALGLFVLALIAAFASLHRPVLTRVSAHAEQRIGTPTAPIPVRWTTGPVRYRINSQSNANLANIAAGSLPVQSIESAFQTLSAAANLALQNQGPTSIAEAGNDGTNLVTFVDTPANRALTLGAIAVTVTTFAAQSGAIQDADIVFNPAVNFSTVGGATDFDIESVTLHEAGHFIGQDHSPLVGAVMFPFARAGEAGGRRLTEDDRAGAETIYATGGGTTVGSVSGRVLRNGSPVFGAHVVFQEQITGRAVLGVLTGPDGRFAARRLPPGRYTPFVEPLDEPFLPEDLITTLAPTSAVDRDFAAAYLGGGTAPNSVVLVSPGSQQTLSDILVTGPAPAQNLRFLGVATGLAPPNLAASAIDLPAGALTTLTVAGPGFRGTTASQWQTDSPFLSLGSTILASGTLTNGDAFVSLSLRVDPSTPIGTYSIRWTDGNALTHLTGALRVRQSGAPLAAAVSFGQSCGPILQPSRLSARGLPSLGNASFAVELSNTLPYQFAFFFFAGSSAQIPLPGGCIGLLDPATFLFPFPGIALPTSTGLTRLSLPIPNQQSLRGQSIFAQALATDPRSPNGSSLSQGLWLQIE